MKYEKRASTWKKVDFEWNLQLVVETAGCLRWQPSGKDMQPPGVCLSQTVMCVYVCVCVCVCVCLFSFHSLYLVVVAPSVQNFFFH